MNPNTDQSYIARTLEGDTRAFGVLVERYQDFVFTIVLRMLKVHEEAEEIAQDTFVKAYEALSSYRAEAKFSTWLYKIAYRKALDRIRKNSRAQTMQLIEDRTEDNFETTENALHYLEDQERKKVIADCLMQLPEMDSAVISLFYYEEQSVREIAEITGLSEDNVKVKLHRSRKKLFGLLKQYVQPEITENNGKAI